MMSQIFAIFIASFSANSISDCFIYIILLLLLTSIIFSLVGKFPSFSRSVPNVLTSLGILGTFAGIVVGLMGFDPQNIDGSIEGLLSGLKTAFLTSLVGMSCAIIHKVVIGLIPIKTDETLQDVGPEDILTSIRAGNDTAKMLLQALQGEGDSSLSSQLGKIRLDLNDMHKDSVTSRKLALDKQTQFSVELWNKMDQFGELLSKSATEQVINALKEVIVEFNDKLTEQFGENFKRLDESVKKLVDWQENYRNQLDDMAVKYQLGVDAISASEKSIANINENTQAIPKSMEKLQTVMELGHEQIQELEVRLEAFKDLRDKAIEAMPEIRNQLDSTMKTISDAVGSASNHYQVMLDESQKVMNDFSTVSKESIETLRTNLESGANEVSKQLTESAHTIGGKLAEASADIQDNVSSATGGLSNATAYLTNTTEQIRQHLEDSITELNSQLRVLVADIKDDSRQTGEILKTANRELLDQTREVHLETVSNIKKFQDRLETTLDDVFQAQTRAARSTFDSLEDQISQAIGKTGSAVEKQVEVLDLQMQQELNRTLNELGQGLATITQQFTRDYQKLVSEMNRVVQIQAAV
jgi:ElaB/YqjD/DUF883 family membrane-anchored ribosome-binding protein